MEDLLINFFIYTFIGVSSLILLTGLGILFFKCLYMSIRGCLIKGHQWELIDQKLMEAESSRYGKRIYMVYTFKCKRCGDIKKEEVKY